MKLTRILLLAACVFTVSPAATLHAQGTTAFTYQGQLHDNGTNANGTYTMIFKLYDAVSNGTQIGAALTNSPALSNGLFSVNLDFGPGAFNGSSRWLDITISNSGTSQTLSPRVQVLPTPYAQFAAVAATITNGGIMNAQLAANAVNSANIASGQVVKSLNGFADNMVLSAGANVSLATNANGLTTTIQISAASGGGTTYVTNIYTSGVSFVPTIQVFRTSGAFVAPAGVTKIEVEVWGGGGGGGNGYNDGVNTWSGGGGGSGSYNLGVFTVTPGTSYPVTVGGNGNAGQSGGTCSFSTLITASGGSAGGNATAGGSGAGGTGGTGTGGLLGNVLSGGDGAPGDQPFSGLGGLGGSVWRGGVSIPGVQNEPSGPACGGSGGNPGSSGIGGTTGAVIIYY